MFIYRLATLLDPRFKDTVFRDTAARERAVNNLKALLKESYEAEAHGNLPNENEGNVSSAEGYEAEGRIIHKIFLQCKFIYRCDFNFECFCFQDFYPI